MLNEAARPYLQQNGRLPGQSTLARVSHYSTVTNQFISKQTLIAPDI